MSTVIYNLVFKLLYPCKRNTKDLGRVPEAQRMDVAFHVHLPFAELED